MRAESEGAKRSVFSVAEGDAASLDGCVEHPHRHTVSASMVTVHVMTSRNRVFMEFSVQCDESGRSGQISPGAPRDGQNGIVGLGCLGYKVGGVVAYRQHGATLCGCAPHAVRSCICGWLCMAVLFRHACGAFVGACAECDIRIVSLNGVPSAEVTVLNGTAADRVVSGRGGVGDIAEAER